MTILCKAFGLFGTKFFMEGVGLPVLGDTEQTCGVVRTSNTLRLQVHVVPSSESEVSKDLLRAILTTRDIRATRL